MYTPDFDRAHTDPWSCIDAPVPRGHYWYFAYGSNMSIEQLRLRVGEPARHTLVVIPHWAMAITKPSKKAPLGYANIFPHPDSIQILASELQHKSEMQNLRTSSSSALDKITNNTMAPSTTTTLISSSANTPSSPIHQKIVKNHPDKCRTSSIPPSSTVGGGNVPGARMGSPNTNTRSVDEASHESLPSKTSSSSLSRIASALISQNPTNSAADPPSPTDDNHRHVIGSETPLYLETPEMRRRGISAPLPHHTTPSVSAGKDSGFHQAIIGNNNIDSPAIHTVHTLPCDNESGRIADCPPYVVCTAYLLNEDQLRLMDGFEGAPQHYRRVELSALAMQLPKSWLEAPNLENRVKTNISGLHTENILGSQHDSNQTPDSSGDVLGTSTTTASSSLNQVVGGVPVPALDTVGGLASNASPHQFGDLSPLELLERVVQDYGKNEPRSGLGALRGSTYDDVEDPLHSALEIEAANSYDNSLVVHSNDEAASILTQITGVAYIFGCVPSSPSDAQSGSSTASSPLSPEVTISGRTLSEAASTSRFVSSSIDAASPSQLGLNAGLGSPTSCGTGMAVIDTVEEAPIGVPPRPSVSVLTSLTAPSILQAQILNTSIATTSSSQGHHGDRGPLSSPSSLSCLPLHSTRGVPRFPIPGTTPPISAVDVGCILVPSTGYLGRIREGINPIKNHILLISLFTSSSSRRLGRAEGGMPLSPSSVAKCDAVRGLLMRYVEYLESIEPSAVESPRNKLREAGKV